MSIVNLREEALKLHYDCKGKLTVNTKIAVDDARGLSLAYSPGVAEPCKEILQDSDKVYDYTMKGNLVAVISDGSAVLGLGNIGPEAALPVMEGKAVLFKSFAGIDAFPICLNTSDADKMVEIIKVLEPTFGGINLEDIKAPYCFYIEDRLKQEMQIPVFHDDQHGTAIVTGAALLNALKIVGKNMADSTIVINGAGAAGVATANLLLKMGAYDVILCDSNGAIFEGREKSMNDIKQTIARRTNKQKKSGSLSQMLQDADVFIGVSVAGMVTKQMIQSMNRDPIVFAMANPEPEIFPEEAKEAGAKVVGTGRSDYPNQVNNVLAFPGVFRGALDVFAKEINEEMKLAAVHAIANLVSPEELTAEYVVPAPFDERVVPQVAQAVAEAAIRSGVARRHSEPAGYVINA